MTYIICKRFFDFILSLFAAILMVLPWLCIAAIISVQSPGPVVYKATRVGLNGKRFTLYKFRTMCVDSGDIRTTTLRTDERIFRFGHFLRRSKLDETLQIINILKGDMSIIGPRPEDVVNADTIYVGKYEKILTVKPGLSSPASLYDYTHGEKIESVDIYDKDFLPQKLNLELYYVENCNVIYDLSIIIRTIITIVTMICGKDTYELPRELAFCEEISEKEMEIV